MLFRRGGLEEQRMGYGIADGNAGLALFLSMARLSRHWILNPWVDWSLLRK